MRHDGGQQGFQTQETATGAKTRRRAASFDDHFSHATLFWNSQSAAEKEHIVAALQYELSRVETPAIRQRVVDNLAHVDVRLARKVAEPLGIGPPDPRAAAGRSGFREGKGGLSQERSASLSLESNGGGIHGRRVAVVMAAGAELGAYKVIQQALLDAGARTCVVAGNLGFVSSSSGQQVPVDHTFAGTPSVMFDAVLVTGGATCAQNLVADGSAVHFVLEAYRHCKPLCVIGESVEVLRVREALTPENAASSGVILGKNDPVTRNELAQAFIAAIGKHRHWSRPGIEAIPA
jgi:catalase